MTVQKAIPLLILLSVWMSSAHADALIPNEAASPLYYQLGGGQSLRLPTFQDQAHYPFGASAAYDGGYNCQAFNPAVSLTETVNQLQDSLSNAKAAVITNLTAAVGHLPMYLLARANPTLYNLLNNALIEASESVLLSTKSCETLKRETAEGINPYQQWGSLALSDHWQQEIHLATHSGAGDVHAAEQTINETSGDAGIPWVQGIPDGQIKRAGGQAQPPIAVLHDTSLAGYNVVLNRALDDDSIPVESSALLVTTWADPIEAADWITRVLGETTIQTCQQTDCGSHARAGQGLLSELFDCDQTHCVDHIETQLLALVEADPPWSMADLHALSSVGFSVSPAIIHALQALSPLEQTLTIQRLAQTLAVQHTLDNALLARRLLLTGSRVPTLNENQPAQQVIQAALSELREAMDELLFEETLRREASTQIAQVILKDYDEQLETLAHLSTPAEAPMLWEGAHPADNP